MILVLPDTVAIKLGFLGSGVAELGAGLDERKVCPCPGFGVDAGPPCALFPWLYAEKTALMGPLWLAFV